MGDFVYVILFIHINLECCAMDNIPNIVGVYTEEKEALKIYEIYERGKKFFEYPSHIYLEMIKIQINVHEPSHWYESAWDKVNEDSDEDE